MGGCCIYKRPFDHEGAWTCPTCNETSVLDQETARRGGEIIRGMFAPSDEAVAEAMLDCFASNLRVAAGLERAFRLGAVAGYWSCSCGEAHPDDWINPAWRSNTTGDVASEQVDWRCARAEAQLAHKDESP